MSIARPNYEGRIDPQAVAESYGFAVSSWINSKNGRKRSGGKGRRFMVDNAEPEVVAQVIKVLAPKDRLVVMESSADAIQQIAEVAARRDIPPTRLVCVEDKLTRAEEAELGKAQIVVVRGGSLLSPFGYLSTLSGRRLDGFVFPSGMPDLENDGSLFQITRAASLTRRGGSVYMSIAPDRLRLAEDAVAREGLKIRRDMIKDLQEGFKAARVVL